MTPEQPVAGPSRPREALPPAKTVIDLDSSDDDTGASTKLAGAVSALVVKHRLPKARPKPKPSSSGSAKPRSSLAGVTIDLTDDSPVRSEGTTTFIDLCSSDEDDTAADSSKMSAAPASSNHTAQTSPLMTRDAFPKKPTPVVPAKRARSSDGHGEGDAVKAARMRSVTPAAKVEEPAEPLEQLSPRTIAKRHKLRAAIREQAAILAPLRRLANSIPTPAFPSAMFDADEVAQAEEDPDESRIEAVQQPEAEIDGVKAKQELIDQSFAAEEEPERPSPAAEAADEKSRRSHDSPPRELSPQTTLAEVVPANPGDISADEAARDESPRPALEQEKEAWVAGDALQAEPRLEDGGEAPKGADQLITKAAEAQQVMQQPVTEAKEPGEAMQVDPPTPIRDASSPARTISRSPTPIAPVPASFELPDLALRPRVPMQSTMNSAAPLSLPANRALVQHASDAGTHVSASVVDPHEFTSMTSIDERASRVTHVSDSDPIGPPERIAWTALSSNASIASPAADDEEIDELNSDEETQRIDPPAAEAAAAASAGPLSPAAAEAEDMSTPQAVVRESDQAVWSGPGRGDEVGMQIDDMLNSEQQQPMPETDSGEPAANPDAAEPASPKANDSLEVQERPRTRSRSAASSVEEPLRLLQPPKPTTKLLSLEEQQQKGRFLSLRKGSSRVLLQSKPQETDALQAARPAIEPVASTSSGGSRTLAQLLAAQRGIEPLQEDVEAVPVLEPPAEPMRKTRKVAVSPRKAGKMRQDVPRIPMHHLEPNEFDFTPHEAVRRAMKAEGKSTKQAGLGLEGRAYTPSFLEAWLYERCAEEEPLAPPIPVRKVRRGKLKELEEGDVLPPLDWMYSNKIVFADNVPAIIPRAGCDCVGGCKPDASCACARHQKAAFELQAKQNEYRPPFTNAPYFAYDGHGRLLIDSDPHHVDANLLQAGDSLPIYECNSSCSCSADCMNRVAGRGRRVKLALALTAKMGFGVFNAGEEDIQPGTFIGHYSGEMLRIEDARHREEAVYIEESSYVFDLDFRHLADDPELALLEAEGLVEMTNHLEAPPMQRSQSSASQDGKAHQPQYALDARFFRNLTGATNHRCSPNLHTRPFYTDDLETQRPLLAFFTQRRIKPGEQLFISYKTVAHRHEFLIDPPKRLYTVLRTENGDEQDSKAAHKGRKGRHVQKPRKTVTLPGVVPTAAATENADLVETIMAHNGKPLRASRAKAETQLEHQHDVPMSSDPSHDSDAPLKPDDVADESAENLDDVPWDQQEYFLDRSGTRTCFCDAANCDYQMFATDTEPPCVYEGDASKPAVKLDDDDEGIHIRVVNKSTGKGSRWILDSTATFAQLVVEHCEHRRLDASKLNFATADGRDAKDDHRPMAEVQPDEDSIIEYWPIA